MVTLYNDTEYWQFNLTGFGYNTTEGIFTNLTSGPIVSFDLSLQGLALTPDAYDAF